MPGDRPDDLAARLAAYLTAWVELPTLGVVLVPQEATSGPFPLDDPAHVLTAHDPGTTRLTAAENARRGRLLRDDLRRRGLPTRPTAARDRAGGHREEGVLVTGLDDAAACRWGRAWGQDAVFRWTAADWSVLPCAGGRPLTTGWRLDPWPTPPGRAGTGGVHSGHE